MPFLAQEVREEARDRIAFDAPLDLRLGDDTGEILAIAFVDRFGGRREILFGRPLLLQQERL